MSLGKAMIHARKQKSLAKAAAHIGEQSWTQSSQVMQMPVLVLNASYEPINICGRAPGAGAGSQRGREDRGGARPNVCMRSGAGWRCLR